METYTVEYELPPLRAIYYDDVEAASTFDAWQSVKNTHPTCHIRAITTKEPKQHAR